MRLAFLLALVLLASAFSLNTVLESIIEKKQHESNTYHTIADIFQNFYKNEYAKKATPFDEFLVADCTAQLAVECAFDIEKTVVACAAAFESGGANIIADLKCTKDLLADKKTCWPCICYEAQKKSWHIIGC